MNIKKVKKFLRTTPAKSTSVQRAHLTGAWSIAGMPADQAMDAWISAHVDALIEDSAYTAAEIVAVWVYIEPWNGIGLWLQANTASGPVRYRRVAE